MIDPCPPNMPRAGNVTVVVKPALRTDSMRRSDGSISLAARTQLVVAGRSSGPIARVTGAAAVAGAVTGVGSRVVVVWPRPPRPAAVVAVARLGMPTVLKLSISPG